MKKACFIIVFTQLLICSTFAGFEKEKMRSLFVMNLFLLTFSLVFFNSKVYAAFGDILEMKNPSFSCVVAVETKYTALTLSPSCLGDVVSENKLLTYTGCVGEQSSYFIVCPYGGGEYKVIEKEFNNFDHLAILKVDAPFDSKPVYLPEDISQMENLIENGICRIFDYVFDRQGYWKNVGINVKFRKGGLYSEGGNFRVEFKEFSDRTDPYKKGPLRRGGSLICKSGIFAPYIRIGSVVQVFDESLIVTLLSSRGLKWLKEEHESKTVSIMKVITDFIRHFP